MFKKLAAVFLFALGLGASSAYAYEPDECEYWCQVALDKCTSTVAMCSYKYRLCMRESCQNPDW